MKNTLEYIALRVARKIAQCDMALNRLRNCAPQPLFASKLAPLVKLLGKQRYNEGFTAIFELLQYEQLNKQVSVHLMQVGLLYLHRIKDNRVKHSFSFSSLHIHY